MKKLILFIVSLLILQGVAGNPLKSHVDERYELTSIVFRLAGAKEYSLCRVPGYAKDIDSTFAPYKDHKLIAFIQEIRRKDGVSYGDVPAVAGLLEIRNGKIVLQPGVIISELKKEEIGRWTQESFKTFLKYLNDFYKKSKFHAFYSDHLDLYRIAENRLDVCLAEIDTGWFESVFGEKLEDPVIIASLTNGTSNYGGSFGTGQNRKPGVVIGAGNNGLGLPEYNIGSVPVILHELLHNFTDRRSDQYWPLMDSAAQKIFPHVRERMYKNAYPDAKTTMLEWFNNLMVKLYYLQRPQALKVLHLPMLIASDQNRGFIWMERSVLFMQHFIDNRDRYTTIDNFMPQMVNFINYTADHFDQVLDEFDHRRPYIVDAYPLPGSTVMADVDTIMIRFSEPMFINSGLRPIKDSSISSFSPGGMPQWKDKYTFVLPLEKGKLQKGKTYGIELICPAFASMKGYAMEGSNFKYTFKVAEEKASAPTPENTAGNDKNPSFSSKTAEMGKTHPSKPTN